MDDLTAFITARLDEDEAAAKAATPGPWEAETFIDDNDPVGVEYLVSAPAEARVVVGAGLGHDQAEAETVHIARHDPARVLREAAAKRAIVDLAAKARQWTEGSAGATAGYASVIIGDTLRHLATVWSDQPGYRQEWAPET